MRIRTGCKGEKGLNKASIEIESESKPNKALRVNRLRLEKGKVNRLSKALRGTVIQFQI